MALGPCSARSSSPPGEFDQRRTPARRAKDAREEGDYEAAPASPEEAAEFVFDYETLKLEDDRYEVTITAEAGGIKSTRHFILVNQGRWYYDVSLTPAPGES